MELEAEIVDQNESIIETDLNIKWRIWLDKIVSQIINKIFLQFLLKIS